MTIFSAFLTFLVIAFSEVVQNVGGATCRTFVLVDFTGSSWIDQNSQPLSGFWGLWPVPLLDLKDQHWRLPINGDQGFDWVVIGRGLLRLRRVNWFTMYSHSVMLMLDIMTPLADRLFAGNRNRIFENNWRTWPFYDCRDWWNLRKSWESFISETCCKVLQRIWAKQVREFAEEQRIFKSTASGDATQALPENEAAWRLCGWIWTMLGVWPRRCSWSFGWWYRRRNR